MKYISTRGGIAPVTFKEAVMMGLANDGGLLLPESLPQVDGRTVEQWRALGYVELAQEVIALFADDIPAEQLRQLLTRSYATFAHPEVTPLVSAGEVRILELFHGPTLAFKDVALQFLGNVFEYLLRESGERMNILGATSGDTGSAAIQGVRGKERINIFILHPYKKVSPIQELQMTSVTDANVFNLAIRGTFDDGQAIVKSIFSDLPFKEKYRLGAINSINWARVMAQVVYYVWAALRETSAGGAKMVDFSVPTGNFGDIFAGYVAKRMLPGTIRHLVLATNENDILSRFVSAGDYSIGTVKHTSSPSMDIQLASNFERYLYYLHDEDAAKTRAAMESMARTGALRFDAAAQEKIRGEFLTKRVSEAEIESTIRDCYQRHGYVLDPHTAVGVNAGLFFRQEGVPMVCLATAHPAKFGEAVGKAIGEIPLPPSLAALLGQETRCEVMAAEVGEIRDFVARHAI